MRRLRSRKFRTLAARVFRRGPTGTARIRDANALSRSDPPGILMRLFFRRQETAAHSAERVMSQTPSPWIAFLHLVVLTNFAVTQPVYDRLSERPAFLADSGLELSGVMLLVVVFSVFIPATAGGLVIAAGRLAPRLRDSLYAIAIFGLLVFISLPIVKRVSFPLGWQTMVLGLGLAAAGSWSYFNFRRCRSLVTAAAP